MPTLDDLQSMAFNVAALPSPKRHTGAQQAQLRDSAIFKYWLSNKDVGTPMTSEIALNDGTTALVTSTGRVLHWRGGDEVVVL